MRVKWDIWTIHISHNPLKITHQYPHFVVDTPMGAA